MAPRIYRTAALVSLVMPYFVQWSLDDATDDIVDDGIEMTIQNISGTHRRWRDDMRRRWQWSHNNNKYSCEFKLMFRSLDRPSAHLIRMRLYLQSSAEYMCVLFSSLSYFMCDVCMRLQLVSHVVCVHVFIRQSRSVSTETQLLDFCNISGFPLKNKVCLAVYTVQSTMYIYE